MPVFIQEIFSIIYVYMQQDKAYVWVYVIIKYNAPDSYSNGQNKIFNQIRLVYLNMNHKSNLFIPGQSLIWPIAGHWFIFVTI